MNKAAIQKFAVWARTKLISEITYKMRLLGITDKGIAEPLPQSSGNLQVFDIGTKHYAEVAGVAIKQRAALVKEIRRRAQATDYNTALPAVIEEVAYTWFNRLIAVRFMEVNDYLPSGVRVLSSETPAKSEPDLVTHPFDADLGFTPLEQDKIIQLKDENKLDELFRMLFIKQCNVLHDILPELFEKTDDYTELLLPISFTDQDGVVYHLTHDIAEADFHVGKEGRVEIIGWLYQYYNTELKADTFARLKKNVKITKERIPAATQLFTPDWIVRYMVENSLGRLWLEGHPDAKNRLLPTEEEQSAYVAGNRDPEDTKWHYYLEEAAQEPEVQAQLEKIRKQYQRITPEEIKMIDPCMGSGHILVYAFDVLMEIYESCGYATREAVASIVENNIYGLDIDDRAAQLAYFAVMMKARQYDRRFFSRGIRPHVYAIVESNHLDKSAVEYFCNEDAKLTAAMDPIIRELHDAKEYGSILNVTPQDWPALYDRFAEIAEDIHMSREAALNDLLPLVQMAEALAQKYDVVVTNPPYMGSSGMSKKLSNYVKTYYPDSKSDLSTVCMERATNFCGENGYWTMINIPVWMFLSSYEKLRNKLFKLQTLTSMVHPGRGIFGSDFGTTTFVFQKRRIFKYKGHYRRLFDKQGEVESIEQREQRFFEKRGVFFASQDNFSKIPGSPVAYWARDAVQNAFAETSLYTLSSSPSQNVTGNNDKYVRKHWELPRREIGGADDWIFYAKGGGFRKWWGNLTDVVNWSPEARKIYQFGDGKHASQIINKEYWYKKGITWGLITSALPSFRVMPSGATFDKGGSTIIVEEAVYSFVLGLLNSCVYLTIVSMLNPTLNFQVKDVRSMPLILNEKERIDKAVDNCVNESKADWDSYETSWDFKRNPLM